MIMNWKVSKQESELIDSIALRAEALARRLGVKYTRGDANMDITCVHVNIRPLRLAELASADEGNFGHDVFGIRRHLDRENAKLMLCFVPRYSA